MNRLLGAMAGILVPLLLSGCTSDTRDVVAADPSASAEPEEAGEPTWGDCGSHSMQIIDYTVDAHGAETRGAAIEEYRIPGDHVVDRPARPHRNAEVLLVDGAGVIHHALELTHAENGWLVNTVEACAD